MPSTFLVPADSPLLADPDTHVLHHYTNGTVVVKAARKAERVGEPLARANLRLAAGTATRTALTTARRAIRAAAGQPVAEDEPAVTAYVEFVAPPDPRWLAAIQQHGVAVLAYQPDNSYLVRGRRSDLAGLAEVVRTTTGESAIRSVTELTRSLKSGPTTVGEAGDSMVVVLAATAEERDRTVAALHAIPGVEVLSGAGNDVLDEQRIRVRARVHQDGVEALLALPNVLSLEEFVTAVPEDEVAGLIVAGQLDPAHRPTGSYDRWLADHEVDGAGAVIGIVDAGVDVDHVAFAGRARDLADGRKDWHATMVAGHAAGGYRAERDPDGFRYGLGTAPGAVVLSQNKLLPAREVCRQTAVEAGSAIAIQNNSWGRQQLDPMDYGSDEALYDALVRNARQGDPVAVPLTVCFSSGNSGPAGLTRPKSAKNVIVTGNSENYRPDVGGADSDDVRDVYTGARPSSQGNCADGRIRPHVVAPGEWTSSANFESQPGEVEFVSPRITWGGGSSGASPKTAGACALLAQWWRRWHAGTNPSPAMLRALVVNGAEPIATGGPIPNNRQGWGRLSLRDLLDPDIARLAMDQADLLSGPGQARQWSVRVVDPRRPVKVTLAWTDPPGAIGSGTATSNPIVNRLALRVQAAGRTWRGGADRFRGGWSADDDALDHSGAHGLREEGSDNLQNVFLPAGDVSSFVVSVTALTVTTNALTGRFDLPQQDFALVVTNAEIDHSVESTVVVTGSVGASAVGGAQTFETADEAAWWAAGEPAPTAGEAAAESGSRLASPAAALAAAAAVLGASGNRLDAAGLAADADLARAAAAVRDRLGEFTGGLDTGAAVLAVPAGTAVTTSAVDDLRALVGLTDLYLVSDDGGLLGRLAARIGRHASVRYRLADGPSALPALLRDTALEAAGMQQLLLGPAPVDDTGTATVAFGVVAADGTLVLGLGAGATTIALRRPGHDEVVVWAEGAAIPVDGVRVTVTDDRLELAVDRAGATPGHWTVGVTGGAATPPDAWVQGGAPLVVTTGEVGPGRRLLRVTADPGGLVRQVSMPRVRRTADPSAAETDRPLVVKVRPSRLDRVDETQDEAGRDAVGVPALGHVFELPSDAPAVVDLRLDVVGTDPAGTVYARRVHADVVTLPPPSGRAAADRADAGAVQVTGRIDELQYRGGTVVGVRVSNGRRTRRLDVRAADLGAAIAAVPGIAHDTVTLGVHGAELQWVYRPLVAEPVPIL